MRDYTKMILLTESFEAVEYTKETKLNEATNSEETLYYIKGIFSTPDQINSNGRIYPLALWLDEVAKYQLHLQNDGSLNSYGEYEHPPRSTVDKDKAVIQMKELYIQDGLVYGKALILKGTHKTKDLENAIENGLTIGVSSRGLGLVGDDNIVTDFMLITYDAVENPSDYNANLSGYKKNMNESNEEIEKLKKIIEQQSLEIKKLKGNNEVNESNYISLVENLDLFLEEKLSLIESDVIKKLSEGLDGYFKEIFPKNASVNESIHKENINKSNEEDNAKKILSLLKELSEEKI